MGRNNIFCISRDFVLTNQQLASLYSSGLAKGFLEAFVESFMEMCERNSLNPGYVGSLLNFSSPESLYFSNLRGNGAQIPGLHQLPYNRRDVCTLPWTSTSSSCTPGPAAPPQSRAFGGYCSPFLPNAGPLNSSSSSSHIKTHVGDSARCFQGANHKTEESGRHEEVYVGIAGDRGYSDVDRSHGPAAQLDVDSAAPLHINGTKQDQNPAQASSSHTCSRTNFTEG